MIKIENTNVVGFEDAIRGMRNPMNSWEKSDSGWADTTDTGHVGTEFTYDEWRFNIGPNDQTLMLKLAKAGAVHAKFRRMIVVYVDITAPLYWWKEFDTYKVGTVANSCSTMHKIQEKEFTLDDFSHEHLSNDIEAFDDQVDCGSDTHGSTALELLTFTIDALNLFRKRYLKTKDKDYWWQMIQLLPTSYNQRRTIMMSYEVLAGMYTTGRRDHNLDEWQSFCHFIESLPYGELITGEESCK